MNRSVCEVVTRDGRQASEEEENNILEGLQYLDDTTSKRVLDRLKRRRQQNATVKKKTINKAVIRQKQHANLGLQKIKGAKAAGMSFCNQEVENEKLLEVSIDPPEYQLVMEKEVESSQVVNQFIQYLPLQTQKNDRNQM